MSSFIVSVDHIAFLRNLMAGDLPEPSHAAVLAQLAGADGIAGRLRRDRQLIRDRDLYVLREVVKNDLILYIYPDKELMDRAIEVRPETVVLTPETDHPFEWTGIRFETDQGRYFEAAERLKSENLQVGFFVDPDEDSVKAAARARVDLTTLNCRDLAVAKTEENIKTELEGLEFAGQLAIKLGLRAAVCGGLGNDRIRPLLNSDTFRYITLGRGIISQAMMVGMERAVRDAVQLFKGNLL